MPSLARYVPSLLAIAVACVGSGSALAAPDEEILGKAAGYPLGTPRTWFYDEGVRVGSFSHLDRIFSHNKLRKSGAPSKFEPATPAQPLTFRFQKQTLTVSDFLDHQRITGLMIIKDGQVLAEHYQYDRNAGHRLVSQSMAKSIISIAVGFALAERKIKSLDDKVAAYLPVLADSGYGETTIRNLLRMSSGVKFSETYDGNDDLARFSVTRATKGTIAALRLFQEREAPEGTRFKYATAETVVLVAVLRHVVGGSVSDYLTERLWQPMGAEADATWITSRPDGYENGGGGFNAVLRDYGRLGVLLADDGRIGNRQVLPKDYLIEATDWRRHPVAFHPRKATPYFGYGYQFWIYPGETRRFALLGVYGQSIFVDPQLKLVLVITAAARNASVGKESLASERDALWRGLVGRFGKW
jgi:CubicO group peptidase (beta-lactamase class C family)